MHTANLELCKELYGLSGWHTGGSTREEEFRPPEYDLGYLLRKLPKWLDDIRDTAMLGRTTYNKGWSIVYRDLCYIADTPENAVCKLLIELLKQNTLPKPVKHKPPFMSEDV